MKVRYFDSFDSYSESGCSAEYETVAVIRENGWIKADLATICKNGQTALNRFFKAVADIPELADWKDSVKESCSNGYCKDNDFYMAGGSRNEYPGYAFELEAPDDDSWYFFLNVRA